MSLPPYQIHNSCKVCSKKVKCFENYLKCSILCRWPVHIECINVAVTNLLFTQAEVNIWMCNSCAEYTFQFNHLLDGNEFLDTVNDCCSDHNRICIENVQNKVFNPFDFNSESENSASKAFEDVDPDIQFFNDMYVNKVSPCDYCLENTFNRKASEIEVNSLNLSLIHLNIRSAPKNLSKFETYLKCLNLKFSVIALSETWVDKSNVGLSSLDGYQHEYQYRSYKHGGGVSISEEWFTVSNSQ